MTEVQEVGKRFKLAGGDLRWIVGKSAYSDVPERAAKVGARVPPFALGSPGIGHLRRLRRDRLGFLLSSFVARGDAFVVRVPWMYANVLSHPDHVRHVLQQHHENYGKRTRGFDQIRLFLGNGLLTSEGAFWLRQRRIAQPAFHKQRLAGFATSMVKAAEDLVVSWRNREQIDVSREMMRVTLRIVSETLLGRDVSGEADAVGHAITELLENVQSRMAMPFDVPLHWPTPKNRQYHRASGVIDGVMNEVIAERRRSPGHSDLLAMLMEATDEETGERMSDKQLRDEAMTIFVAGHETTANNLAWTFYLLSKHPAARRRLYEELASVLGGRSPTVEDLPRLEWTRWVIQESMRLYPPAWITGRNTVEDDVVGGWFVPRGSLMFVSPMLVHRHPDFWDDPEGFDPERFSPSRSAGRPTYAYFPFGGGPRQCIGNGFAMMEAQLLLATIAQHIELDLLPGAQVTPEPVVTLRPRHGLPMRVLPRG
ncbi:MAG: cytochrome P450 [Polyangiales bacterium]